MAGRAAAGATARRGRVGPRTAVPAHTHLLRRGAAAPNRQRPRTSRETALRRRLVPLVR